MVEPTELARTARFERVRVDVANRPYDIVIGTGALAETGALLGPLLTRPYAVIVTDETVDKLHGAALRDSLSAAGIACETILLPPGERTKSFAELAELAEGLIAKGVERNDFVIAFGGGVVGDIAGLAAAIVRRGVQFAQIPTTLLSQVDSAVGGKTAVNSRHGKNLIGAFYQPRIVISDTALLDSLAPRDLRAGYAEVVKYGLIDRADFFAWLEENGVALLAGDAEARRHAIAESCRAKAGIVAQDERETGNRALLNLGHSFGHAIEAAIGYGSVLHGEAVAIGCVMALRFSQSLGLCAEADVERLRAHLAEVDLPRHPVEIGLDVTASELVQHMRQDKKVVAGRHRLILSRGIGRAFIAEDVDEAKLHDFLETFLPDAKRSA